jgi:hypothetical protein
VARIGLRFTAGTTMGTKWLRALALYDGRILRFVQRGIAGGEKPYTDGNEPLWTHHSNDGWIQA